MNLRERPRVAYRSLRHVTEVHSSFSSTKTEETLIRDGFVHINKQRLSQQYLTFQNHSTSVPSLAHGLDAVVTKSGLYSLKNGSKYNFTPFLGTIHQPEEIDWAAIPPFVNSSRDKVLHRLCLETSAKYKGSTSSMSGILSQAYFLFSKHKPVNIASLTNFRNQSTFFTPASLKPVGIFVRPRDNIYSIDRDKGDKAPDNQLLLAMGKSLERMLTMEPPEFEQTLLKEVRAANGVKEPDLSEEAYSYLKIDNKFLLRSQLDCQHPDVGVFDLKTRATYAIRMHNDDVRSYVDYKLESIFGKDQSYEREFYDMVRAAFLKYIFQVRIGNMAGVFVAYHNTRELFGFEFISLKEMEYYVMSTQAMADASFEASVRIVEHILDSVTNRFPQETLKITMQCTPYVAKPDMTIFVERIPDTKAHSVSVAGESAEAEAAAAAAVTATTSSFPAETAEKPIIPSFEVVNPIYKYSLQLETVLGGLITTGPLKLRSGEWPKVYLNLKEVQQPLHQTVKDYKKMLHESAIYSIADYEDPKAKG